MSEKKKKSVSLRKYKARQEMNIGIFIFVLVFLYLMVMIFTYATSKRISVYEVKEGSIVKDGSYTGLILREETVVSSQESGYIVYFHGEGEKLKAGGNVYALSPTKLQTEAVSESEAASLGAETQKNLILKTQSFIENYSAQKFSSVYALKNEMTTALQDTSSQTKTVQIDTAAAASGGAITTASVPRDGIVSLTLDGYEGLTEDTLNDSSFDRNNYQPLRMEDQMQVSSGTPVYKLITSEKWNVYIQLDEANAKELKNITSIKTKIDKDNETIWADFSIIEKNGCSYGRLSFDTSMIRYVNERFLNIELILEDENGLKIPKSALVERDYYTVPASFLSSGKNSSALGVTVLGDEMEQQYKSAENSFLSEDEQFLYLSPRDFSEGMVLVNPESAETYRLRNKKTLTGVYHINKGYAVFRLVNILCENDDYYIVEKNTAYGLSDYDHIVQDGAAVEEGEIVFQ